MRIVHHHTHHGEGGEAGEVPSKNASVLTFDIWKSKKMREVESDYKITDVGGSFEVWRVWLRDMPELVGETVTLNNKTSELPVN